MFEGGFDMALMFLS